MTDHYVELRYFNDGSHNASNWRLLDAGQAGDFNRPLICRRLGLARQRVYQFRDTTPFACDVLAASMEAQTA